MYYTLFQNSIKLTLSTQHFNDAITEAKPRDGMGIGIITRVSNTTPAIHTGAIHSYGVVDTRTASELRITTIVHTLPIHKHGNVM